VLGASQDALRPSDDALSPMSARLSSVRGSSGGGRRAVALRRSLSDAHQLPHFRRDAAAWIEEMLGVAVPAGSDEDFRAALADGVYLCQILNALKPRTVHHVRRLRTLVMQHPSSSKHILRSATVA